MKLSVNQPQRYAKMRAHTATHLLHAQLAKYFPNTKQAGSLVDSDLFRFDFYADSPLTPKQLKEIESGINKWIYDAMTVQLTETSFVDAIQLGAKAFFEEKYDDEVRLIRVINQEKDTCISAELCGGTHVTNTRDIGAFVILSQEAVASGIKRITALTGPKVIEKLHSEEVILDSQIDTFDVKSYVQIPEKTAKFIKEYGEMKSKLESLETQLLNQYITSIQPTSNTQFQTILKFPNDTNFKALPNLLKQHFPNDTTLLAYTDGGNYIIITDGKNSAKALTQKLDLKGGGSDTMTQGRDENVKKIIQ